MIAQLSHLRPKPGNVDKVIALIKEWGAQTRADSNRAAYSFLCQDEDHLFVVALHADQASYEATARGNAAWLAKLMPLLVDNQGPTFYGTVIAHEGSVRGSGDAFPSAVKLGSRHG